MRILHIDTGGEMRGGQFQVLLLMRALREAGHECTLLAREHAPLWRKGIGGGFPTEAVTLGSVRKYSGRSDIVHAHDARAHTLAAIASRKPFVVSRRVAFPIRRSFGSRWKYLRPARFLAVSDFVAQLLRDAGIREEKIDVIYDAAGPNDFAESGWSPEYPAVALASRDPEKGRDLVESAARQSGVEVVFSDDLVRDLRRASMFVYITRGEGLGSAALLAMQMGVPVIASSVGGLTEVLTDGVSGLYVKNDVNEIVRAMRKVLGSRNLAEALIVHAKQRVGEKFAVERLLAATLASYERAMHD